jgi:hypothetical protein
MDVLEFNRLASGRLLAEDALSQRIAAVSGDRAFAEHVLCHCFVLY